MINIKEKIGERLGISRTEMEHFCQKWNIREMALFGSVLRSDFTKDSDIDIIIKFNCQAKQGLLTISKIKYELEDLLGRNVDILIKESLENSKNLIRRQEILTTAKIIYEQR